MKAIALGGSFTCKGTRDKSLRPSGQARVKATFAPSGGKAGPLIPACSDRETHQKPVAVRCPFRQGSPVGVSRPDCDSEDANQEPSELTVNRPMTRCPHSKTREAFHRPVGATKGRSDCPQCGDCALSSPNPVLTTFTQRRVLSSFQAVRARCQGQETHLRRPATTDYRKHGSAMSHNVRRPRACEWREGNRGKPLNPLKPGRRAYPSSRGHLTSWGPSDRMRRLSSIEFLQSLTETVHTAARFAYTP